MREGLDVDAEGVCEGAAEAHHGLVLVIVVDVYHHHRRGCRWKVCQNTRIFCLAYDMGSVVVYPVLVRDKCTIRKRYRFPSYH